jgi:hypothetical protein
MARSNFNFQTPDELNEYLDKMVLINDKWWTKAQAYKYLSSLWATVDGDKLDDINWNDEWSCKLWLDEIENCVYEGWGKEVSFSDYMETHFIDNIMPYSIWWIGVIIIIIAVVFIIKKD